MGMAVVVLAGCSSSPGAVTREGFESDGLDWPLDADEGQLHCDPPGAVTITVDGVIYAVNGIALSDSRYVDVAEIQLVDESLAAEMESATGQSPDPLPRVSVGDLINKGLDLC